MIPDLFPIPGMLPARPEKAVTIARPVFGKVRVDIPEHATRWAIYHHIGFPRPKLLDIKPENVETTGDLQYDTMLLAFDGTPLVYHGVIQVAVDHLLFDVETFPSALGFYSVIFADDSAIIGAWQIEL